MPQALIDIDLDKLLLLFNQNGVQEWYLRKT